MVALGSLIPKVFFDVSNDSDALFTHFGVELQGVHDLQLMESATRTTTRKRKYLNSLAKCVADLECRNFDTASWKLAKETGERLFKPEYGGSYQVFNQRPMPEQIVAYCVGDVQCLPKLWYDLRWETPSWPDLVSVETKKRIETSQKPEYHPHGAHKALAPWSEALNMSLTEWSTARQSRLDDYYNDCSTNCRDVIDDADYCHYYDD